MKVAIIGMGVVGHAQAEMFGHGNELVTYDVATDRRYPGRISQCDFAVICVGTPPAADGSADLSYLEKAIGQLAQEQPILIRSTVPPGTTDRIASHRGGLTCHAPEFLHEREGGKWRKSINVPWMLLGGGRTARAFFRHALERVYPGDIHECTAAGAELAKYTANLYWATRVTFVNEMAAICSSFGEDWEEVRTAWLADARVSHAYTAMTGFEPGFGGRCWPKDLAALIAAASYAGYEPKFLEAVQDANGRFRR